MTRRQTWAANLRDALAAQPLTQKQLIAALGEVGCVVTQQAVSSWMRGEHSPSTEHQAAIAEVLHVPAHLLFPVTMDRAS